MAAQTDTKMAAGAAVAELNRFKRRVIRAVARMVRQGLQDQSAEDEMWKALQKEVGCDCKLLWERMRTLTLKKMKRLLPAEDRLDAIAAVAQMNLTDWLLFDLVLVHEDIDVISEKSGSQCLTDLINLVQEFEIEGKRGEDLINAWTAATFHYNSFGRQCSPMLLQRRWFQLKKATRTKFYSFWFQYRGNMKLLNDCKDQMPNDLHGLIAQRYPYVVTRPFQEWEELIKERMVILPEEFQAKIRKSNAPKKIDKNEPDLVLVEPQIETIDLGVESDSESGLDSKELKKAPETEYNPTPEPPITIKQEILDQIEIDENPGLDELIDKETELVETNENIETAKGDVNNEEVDEIEVSSDTPEGEHETLNVDTKTVTDEDVIICDDVEEINTVEEFNTVEEINTAKKINTGEEIRTVEEINTVEEISTVEDINTVEEINTVEDINTFKDNDAVLDIDAVKEKNTVEEIDTLEEDEALPKICSVAGSFHEEIGMPQITNVVGNVTADSEALPAVASEGQVISTDDTVCEPDPEPMEVDDTVEEPVRSTDSNVERLAEENNVIDLDEAHAEEDDTPKETYESHTEYVDEILQSVLSRVTKPQVTSTSEVKPREETVSNSYMDLPTDIDFEDDGIEYVDDGIEFNEADDDSDGLTAPNKPDIKEELDDGTPKFDLKLLMQPIVYTTKLDSMNVFKNKSIESVSNKDLLDKALIESKPVNEKSSLDDTDTILKENFEIKKEADNDDSLSASFPSCHEEQSNHSESEDEDTIPEENKIKPTSALLKKPRSRSYNPIQLCKNPDFNTRLKRLTVGFLSSTRNRSLLRMLKPMTIDVSKTFEGKLINGTMYLKFWDGPTVKREPIVEDNSEQASAVLPSAMAVQSLINNTQVNLGDVLPTAPIERTTPIERAHKLQDLILMERQRSFNLPNINDVRRMNQKLLVAEVTPMMRKTSDSTPPVQICTQNNKEPINTLASNEKKPPRDISFGNKDVGQKIIISQSGAAQKDIQVQNIQIPKSKAVSETRNSRFIEKQPQNAGNNEVVAGPSSSRFVKYYERPNNVFNRGKFNNGYKLLPEKRLLPWNKLRTGPILNDTLLTLDTLNKMLSIVNSTYPVEAPKTSKKLKKSLEKKRLELEKRMEEFERKRQVADGKTVNVEDKKEDNNVSKKESKVKIPKIKTVVKQSLFGEHCCWARLKLVDPTKAVITGHRCPRLCKCCCRKKLAEHIVNQRSKEQGILISDDDEQKNVSEIKENVVKVTKRQKTKTTRSVQCKIKFTSQDTSSKEAEVALKSIMPNERPSALVARLSRKSVYISRTNSIKVRPNLETIDLDDADNNEVCVGAKATKHKYTGELQQISKVSAVPQGHIVIDATNKLTINTRAYTQNANKLKEKIIYLKHATRKEDGPIYLGKNKILLTNIKFPRKIPFHEPPSRVEVAPSDFPQVLPPGVQLVLLPTGEVTYISEPGATIDAEQMNVLPVIIEAVQKQLNSGSIPEVESISQPGALQMEKNNDTALVNVEDTSAGTLVSLNKSNTENDYDPNMEEQNNQPDLENIKVCTNAQSPNKNTVSSVLTAETISLDSEKETQSIKPHVPHHAEIPDVEITTEDNANNKTPENAVPLEQESENVAEKQTESENVTVSTSRKSLLSDLMAMSGIWDDIQPEPPISNENITEGIAMEVVPALPLVAPLLETPPLVTISDVVPVKTAVDSTPVPLAPISPIKSLYSLGNQMPELTPITSFAQLKYACEQNGKFFKLDLDLGTISSICVSIKPKMKHVKAANLAPKSVIDLTEDEDSVQPVEVREDPGAPSTSVQNQALANRSLLKTAQQHNKSATPLKLFRSVRILRREGSKDREHTILLPAETNAPSRLLINRRKQNIETRQSPPPSEEPEYLDEDSLDSGSLDKYIWKEDGLDLLSTDDDSSDDEPLAAKSKRMKMNDELTNSLNNNPARNLVKDAMDAALLNQSNKSLPPDAENEQPQPQLADNVEPQLDGHPESELVDNQLASNTEPHSDSNMEPQLAGDAPALPQLPNNEEPQLKFNGQPHLPGVYGPESPRDEERDSPMIPFIPDCEDDDDDDGDCILGF